MLLTVPALRAPLRVALTVSLVLTVAALGLVGLRIAADHGPEQAVILADKVSLHSAPDETSQELLALHVGTTVTVVKRLEGWYEVRLTDGRQGWMPHDAGEIVQSFSTSSN
jgi:SH3-like domain-containing protein